MTGRTHDLAAFTALTAYSAYLSVPIMSLATAATAVGAVLLGGLAPDLDKPTADFWEKIPAGSLIGRLIKPLIGGHRLISHSAVGVVIVGFLLRYLLGYLGTVLLTNMRVVFWSFMIGYLSHLVADSFTKEGIPLFFPIPWKFGLPPFKALRITTGGIFEKAVVFPGLLLLTGYIVYTRYTVFLEIIKTRLH
jgi:inner membrane protein